MYDDKITELLGISWIYGVLASVSPGEYKRKHFGEISELFQEAADMAGGKSELDRVLGGIYENLANISLKAMYLERLGEDLLSPIRL